MTPGESHVWRILAQHHGRAEAISTGTLSALTGLHERIARKIVKRLIEIHGCPIASSPLPPAGYYIPETAEEVRETLESLRGRALSILYRMSRLRRSTLRETVDQLLLDMDTAA